MTVRLTLFYVLLSSVLFSMPGVSAAPQNSNPLVGALKSSSAKIRAKTVRAIGNSGDVSAVPDLIKELNDPSTQVRKEVIVALAKLHSNAALGGLVTATRDTDPDVRTLAVHAVVGWYTGNIPSLGFRGMVKKSYGSAKGWFQTDTKRINPGTPLDPRAVSALIGAMNDSRSIQAARDAASGLGILMARSAVPDLIKAAHSPDADLASNALDSLGKIKDVSAGPQLVGLLDSPSKEVRQSACITTGILRTRSAVPKLLQIYQTDTDSNTRKAALDGLAFIGDPSSNNVFLQALSSKDSDERTYAAEGIARSADSSASGALANRMAVEKNKGVKLAILFAQTSIGQTQHLRDLVDAMTSRTRGDVAQSYLVELTRRKTLLHSIYPYLNDSNATIRRRVANVLMYSGDASSLAPLAPLEHDRNSDVAAAALRASQAIRSRTH
ncbi:MAG: HEAT repeat domain-containing protein [Acidobacteriota bacterium]|nr:HEAT repeat domain-containing protein [Acidobacteriota bacterium]